MDISLQRSSGDTPETSQNPEEFKHVPEIDSSNLAVQGTNEERLSESDEHESSPQPSRISHPYRDPSEKKPKLRTSKDVFDRLKWDSESIEIKPNVFLDLTSVYVGYKDRFLGMCELPYEEFVPGGEIPFHRIYYFRNGGYPVDPFIGADGEVKVREDNWPEGAIFLWDRDSRTDLIFHSGNSSITQSSTCRSKPCKNVQVPQVDTPQPPNCL